MTLAGSVAGFATLGFTVRAYALGIQKRPVLEGENEQRAKPWNSTKCVVDHLSHE
jgi:hypothetical protein